MATINSANILQSRFIGTPITVPVTAASPAGTVTFHRVRLTVSVWDANGQNTGLPTAANKVPFQFQSAVDNGVTAVFDISSAFRAFADAFRPQPAVFVYPSLSAEVSAVDDYMIDGTEYEGMSPSATVALTGKYLGALSDAERGFGIGNTWYEPARYSRKPATMPEVCFYKPDAQGASDGTVKHLQPGNTVSGTSPLAPEVTSVSVLPANQNAAGIYGIAWPLDGYELRFINSLGVHENVFVGGLPVKEVSIATTQHTIARQETLTQFSRGLAVKQNDYETWTFSTGPLDQAWASWYIHELLMARWVWIGSPQLTDAGGQTVWIPCLLVPEETVTLVDRSDPKLTEVQIKVRLDVTGGIG